MKKKTQSKFKGWKRDCIDAEIINNTTDSVIIYFYGYIGIKKNSKEIVRGRIISSSRYQERHKRIIDKLSGIKWEYKAFPCKLSLSYISGDRRKGDCDNFSQGIMDIFTEVGVIPDDNKFIVQELNVENKGYIKNCYITRVELSPYSGFNYNIDYDYNGKDLKECKKYFI